jgi:type I restriction enzyme S subunit
MKHWPTKPLEQIADLFGGSTPSRNNPLFWGGDIHWATPTDLPMPDEGISVVSRTRDRITQAGLDNSAATIVPKGTVLFSSRATIGKVAVADIPLTTNQGFANFVPRSEIISRFLAYSLWYRREDIARLSGSTTFKEVSRSTFRKYQIPVPPLAEQERIVKLLDEADELRKLRAQADHCTAELIPAFFHKMFGDPACNSKRWPIVPASDLMILCEYGCSQKANEDSEGVPMLRMGNVTSVGLLDLTNLKHVLFNKDELAKYRLASGDVLFNRTNSRELVGKTGMWDGRFEAVAASYFIRIRFDPAREHPQHFTTFMNLPHMKQRLMEMARGAIGQSNINAQELKAIPIPVPPLPLQKEFAQRVMEIRELEASQAASRLRLEELFQSLLHRAFNGEL